MNAQAHPELQVSLKGSGIAIDSQIAALLHLVDETGSIPDACDMAKMDLLAAWQMLAQAEDALGFPLLRYVDHRSILTEQTRKLLDAFDGFQVSLQKQAEGLFESTSEALRQ